MSINRGRGIEAGYSAFAAFRSMFLVPFHAPGIEAKLRR